MGDKNKIYIDKTIAYKKNIYNKKELRSESNHLQKLKYTRHRKLSPESAQFVVYRPPSKRHKISHMHILNNNSGGHSAVYNEEQA